MKNVIMGLVLGFGIIVTNLANAQDTATLIDSGTDLTASNIDWSIAADWQVALEEIEQMPPMPAIDATNGNTFWSAQHAPGSAEPWPPLPGNVWNMSAWSMGDDNGQQDYLLDDLGFNYHALKRHKASSQSLSISSGTMVMTADDVPAPPGDDDDTNDYGSAGLLEGLVVNYGTNIFIAQMSQGSGNYSGIISNTIAQVPYEIQYTYDLESTNGWQSAGWIFPGSEVTNWTTFSVPMASPTNMFFRVRSWESDDGSGIPTWWEEEYLDTNSVDPNAQDSAGDGWTIYQKYEMGIPPATFTTPPTPQGVTGAYNLATDMASISWQPAPGPVVSYTVEDQNDDTFTVDADEASFSETNDLTPWSWPDEPNANQWLSVKVNYAGGSSGWSGDIGAAGFDAPSPVISLVAGPQGSAYLAVSSSAVPAGTAFVRIMQIDYLANSEYSDDSFDTNYDIPISDFTNGLYLIPAAWLTPSDIYGSFSFIWWGETLTTNHAPNCYAVEFDVGTSFSGPTMGITNAWMTYPYYDGRVQMKQNLTFLLRDATVTTPVTYTPNGAYSSITMPTNYVYDSYNYASIYGIENILTPFYDNYAFCNSVFSTANLDSSGALSNNIYAFQAPSPTTIIPAMLGSSEWLVAANLDDFQRTLGYPSSDPDIALNFIFVSSAPLSAHYSLMNDVTNLYGLEFESVEGSDGISNIVMSASGGELQFNESGVQYFYPATAAPQWQTEEYDFWQSSPLPGSSGFSTTNGSDLLIAPVGGSIVVNGYAKLAMQNGYPGVYAYLGQYFESAYEIDTDGNMTTNQAGILSSYGNFFATQPGPAALVTMPDPDTGQQGTTTVYCVSLNVDANHDGNMDLNFGGSDTTSPINPMEFWVNDGSDISGGVGGLDFDLATPPESPNYALGEITCPRDLENFARLWVCGLPSALSNENYSISLSCSAISGSPAINLYYAGTNGSIGYLTNTAVAAALAGEPALATITPASPYFFPSWSLGGTNQYFLFEGAGIGEGQFTLTVHQGSNSIAQTSVYIKLHDIKDFYERTAITNDTSETVSNWTSGILSTQEATASALGSESNLMVFVHGFNVGNWNWLDDSDTIFKRLYWAGFQGQFMTVKWPCEPIALWTLITEGSSFFNDSEIKAYKAAPSLKEYLSQLRSRFPNYQLNVLAHSQGNSIMGAAIEQGAPFDNYILTQAAMPASSYYFDAPTNSTLLTAQAAYATPQWQPMGYQGIYTNMTGNIFSLYNTNDSALNVWVADQAAGKPDGYAQYLALGTPYYSYDGAHGWYNGLFSSYLVTDPEESLAMISRSLTLPIGKLPPSTGESTEGVIQSTVDTTAKFGFTTGFSEHSAQWTRPIQTAFPYYQELLILTAPVL